MKRTVTEIFIEVEETVAVRLHKQNFPAVTDNIQNTTGELAVCPFCERTFSTETKNTKIKNEE